MPKGRVYVQRGEGGVWGVCACQMQGRPQAVLISP